MKKTGFNLLNKMIVLLTAFALFLGMAMVTSASEHGAAFDESEIEFIIESDADIPDPIHKILEDLIWQTGMIEGALYTPESYDALMEEVENAKVILADETADPVIVNEEINRITQLFNDLTEIAPEEEIRNSDENVEEIQDINSADEIIGTINVQTLDDAEEQIPSYKNLADGEYTVPGNMVKTDMKSASMADDSIDHNIKLTVKDGIYYLTVTFKSVKIGTTYGYLGNLSYFLEGYTPDKYGVPRGETALAQVDAYQLNADGTKISDDFGTDYPEKVTFPLITEGLETGYVPVQVFVPVMEAISQGLGTQEMYLKLDWGAVTEGNSEEEKTEEEKAEEETETYPAVSLTDEKTGISIDAAEGMLPEGVSLVVEELSEGSVYDAAKSNMFISGKDFVLYDIHFLDASGETVEPDGRVQVSMPVPDGWNTSMLALYHFVDDSTASPVVGTMSDGKYVFSTASFSSFALVQRTQNSLLPSGSSLPSSNNTQVSANPSTTYPSVTANNSSTVSRSYPGSSSVQPSAYTSNANTGDTSEPAVWISLIVLSLAAIAAALCWNRRTYNKH